MGSWLVWEKPPPVVMLELLQKATLRLKTADWSPPLLVGQWVQRVMLRREIPRRHWVEPVALRQKTAGWRPPLLEAKQQVRSLLRRVLFALRE
jgi:hypothetical protein